MEKEGEATEQKSQLPIKKRSESTKSESIVFIFDKFWKF